MIKYRKYVFIESHRVHKAIIKHGYKSNFSTHLKRSWKTARILFNHDITPYCGFN